MPETARVISFCVPKTCRKHVADILQDGEEIGIEVADQRRGHRPQYLRGDEAGAGSKEKASAGVQFAEHGVMRLAMLLRGLEE